MKKTRLLILLSLIIFAFTPIIALAYTVKTNNSVYVAADETISGNLYAAGNTITVDGTVEGDVICGAQTVNINGTVEGDVICGGQTINLNGDIKGSARVAGESIIINSNITRGVQAFGANISLASNAEVGWDMFLAGANGEIRGKIAGDLHGGVASIIIAGEVGGDVKFKLDDRVKKEDRGIKFKAGGQKPLTVTDTAKINGNLYYSSGIEGDIAEGAEITGEVSYSMPEKKSTKTLAIARAWGSLYAIFSALVVGLVLISLFRGPIKNITNKMIAKSGASIGWGVIIMFLTPIILIILLITIIGIPLALILSALWLITMYISKIIVGILIGNTILNRLSKMKKDSLIWAMIIGVVIVWLLTSLPLVGWLLSLVAIWWGLGGIWLNFKKEKP